MRVVNLVDLVAEAAGIALGCCSGRIPFPAWNGSDEHLKEETIVARPWFFELVAKNDPDFVKYLEADLGFIMRDGAIPAKYKILMTMVIDALLAHDAGVATIAKRARDTGASEDEIKEAVRIAYLYGGTPALVSALNAFKKD